MASLDKKTIQEKLRKLQEVVGKLEACKKVSLKAFLKDDQTADAAMYNLIIGIEVIVDIGNHILSEVFQIKAEDYSAVIKKLGQTKIIPEKFVEDNRDMAKFRNLLVHEYGQVDLEKVYEHLQKAPGIFRQFARYFMDFLEKIK